MEPWYKRAGDYMLDAFTDIDTSFKGARADVREWASPVTDWMRDADSELMDGIRRYAGPHLSPQIEPVVRFAPDMIGPGADIRDIVEGGATLADALGDGDYMRALEGGALMAGGTLMAAIPGPPMSSMQRGVDEVVDALPMDEASRMARAKDQGDTGYDFFHATNADFPEFDLDRAGSHTTVGGNERAVFLTDNGNAASDFVSQGYAHGYAPGWDSARKAQAEEKFRQIDQEQSDIAARKWWSENVAPNLPVTEQFESGANVMPLRVLDRGGGFDVWDFAGNGYTPEEMEQALKEARRDGRDGVAFKNIVDGGYSKNPRKQNIVAVLNPSSIRSRFAKFDPAKRDSRDLLAGLAMPVAAGSALALALQGYRNEQGDDGTPIYRREQ